MSDSSIKSVQYTPGLPFNPDDLLRYVNDEFTKIAETFRLLADGHLDPSHVAALKPREGDMRYADGTNWDPGFGRGPYSLIDGEWKPMTTPARIFLTPEGGLAVSFINKTGSASIKGEAVQVDVTTDEAMTIASDPYVVQGAWYESGVADGDYGYVVVSGIGEFLLKDGTAAARGHWCRLSDTNGRIDATQELPGYELAGDALAYVTGSTFSGTLADTATDDGAYLVMAEAAGSPGLDASIEFTTAELLPSIFLHGRYPWTHANSIQIQPYDYVAAGWDTTVITMTKGTTVDEELFYTGLQPRNFDATNSKMKLRIYHQDSGNINHRIYIDKLVLGATASVEHFKEMGHCLEDASAGTDVLVKVNIHLL